MFYSKVVLDLRAILSDCLSRFVVGQCQIQARISIGPMLNPILV